MVCESDEITEVFLIGNTVGRTTAIGPETEENSPFGPSLKKNISVKEYDTIIRNE